MLNNSSGICKLFTVRYLINMGPSWMRYKVGRLWQKLAHGDFTMRFGMEGSVLVREPVGSVYGFSKNYRQIDDLAAMLNVIKSGDVLFDVGANYGHYSLAAWDRAKPIEVHAFEPETQAFARLLENRRLNKADWHCQKLALGSQPGFSTISTDVGGYNHIVANGEKGPCEHCFVVTLDDYARGAGVDRIAVLKIDVEGFESEVLGGAQHLLSNQKINWIVLENEGHQKRYNVTEDTYENFFKPHGYTRKDDGKGNFEVWSL